LGEQRQESLLAGSFCDVERWRVLLCAKPQCAHEDWRIAIVRSLIVLLLATDTPYLR
jgi:hypothetical protein